MILCQYRLTQINSAAKSTFRGEILPGRGLIVVNPNSVLNVVNTGSAAAANTLASAVNFLEGFLIFS
jgi:hypothetical protein